MSNWSYVNGVIKVETPFYTPNKEIVKGYIKWAVDEVVKRTGGITGSELDCEYFINVSENSSSSDYTHITGKTTEEYSRGTITLNGSFRDRWTDDTIKEVNKFLYKLNFYIQIDFINICVDDKTIVVNPLDVDFIFREDNEKYMDKFLRIQFKNKNRYFDNIVSERFIEVCNLLQSISPKMAKKVFKRVSSWYKADFTKYYNETIKELKLNT